MLDRILDLAESLGKQIVQPKGQSVSATPKSAQMPAPSQPLNPIAQPVVNANPVAVPSDAKFLYYRIRSFKDNDLGTGYMQGFLKSFSDITEPLSFFIVGSSFSLGLYAKVPVGIQFYFENVFYSSFPTSELVQIETIPQVPVTNYIVYGDKDVIATDKDFTKDGDYLDPMKDIFSVYETVDPMNNVTLEFKY